VITRKFGLGVWGSEVRILSSRPIQLANIDIWPRRDRRTRRRPQHGCGQRRGRASGNGRLDDLAGFARRLALRQGVDILHAFDHLAPHRILVVEEARVVETDEELAVRTVGVLRARHRTHAADMRLAVELLRQVGQLAAAHAGAGRIAALRHEAGDDAVEHDPVVKALAGQLGDALDVQRRQVGAQADDDIAGRQREGKGLIGHEEAPVQRCAVP
jgi:hypothetical protein